MPQARYAPVDTSPGAAAPNSDAVAPSPAAPARWKGNVVKMFFALCIVAGVYVGFTLVREDEAVTASSVSTRRSYLPASPPTPEELKLRQSMQGLLQSASSTFELLADSKEGISRQQFGNVLSAGLHTLFIAPMTQKMPGMPAPMIQTFQNFKELTDRVVIRSDLLSDRLFAVADADKSGFVDADELQALFTTNPIGVAFDVMDANGDGSVDVAEAKPIVVATGVAAVSTVQQVLDAGYTALTQNSGTLLTMVFPSDMEIPALVGILNDSFPDEDFTFISQIRSASMSVSLAQENPTSILPLLSDNFDTYADEHGRISVDKFVQLSLSPFTNASKRWSKDDAIIDYIHMMEVLIQSPPMPTEDGAPPALPQVPHTPLSPTERTFVDLVQDALASSLSPVFEDELALLDRNGDHFLTKSELDLFMAILKPITPSTMDPAMTDRQAGLSMATALLHFADRDDSGRVSNAEATRLVNDALTLITTVYHVLFDVFEDPLLPPIVDLALPSVLAMCAPRTVDPESGVPSIPTSISKTQLVSCFTAAPVPTNDDQ